MLAKTIAEALVFTALGFLAGYVKGYGVARREMLRLLLKWQRGKAD